MRIKKVSLTNFRNYEQAVIELSPERNILLGENAQGKSNFLEAIELLANGTSKRATVDSELVRVGSNFTQIMLSFERVGREETLAIDLRLGSNDQSMPQRHHKVEKIARVNGVSYPNLKHLCGHLATVSFTSEDLGLLRLGPKFRRDWIDSMLLSLKPSMQGKMARYQKIVTQRNRLLKSLFEQGKVSTNQRDELKIWDTQLAEYGAHIIKERLMLLEKLMPYASESQCRLSTNQEILSASYNLKTTKSIEQRDDLAEAQPISTSNQRLIPHELIDETNINQSNHLLASEISHQKIIDLLLKCMAQSRFEEIGRRQSIFGPHRDDIDFFLSGNPALSFASQGQQRSLVLSLKLAQLQLSTEYWQEAPILLLDDVLAELDLNRQSILLASVQNNVQTIISTTHLTGVKTQWFDRAAFISVKAGTLIAEDQTTPNYNFSNSELSLD